MERILNGRSAFTCICMTLLCIPLLADDSQPQAAPAATQPAVSAVSSDIWDEVSFESEMGFDLGESKIDALISELRRTDKPKAEMLEKLRVQDSKKFMEELRLEIGKVLQQKGKGQKPGSDWKQQLQQRHTEFVTWFQKEYPADCTELLKLRDTNAEQYVQRVMDMMTIYEPIQKAQKFNPALATVMKKDIELQKQRDALLVKIRSSEGAEQKQLMDELTKLVSLRFDTIVQKKVLQYESLRKRLERLEQQLDTQAAELENLKKNKARAVDDHIKELMGQTQKISW